MEHRFENFTVLVSKINRSIKKIENIEMLEYDLRSQHVSVLYHLYSAGPLASKDLVEKCEEDKGTISRTLKYLEEHEFIKCDEQNKKRYNTFFYLTLKGEKIGKIIKDKIDSILNEVSVSLDNYEIDHFYDCLSKISNKLESLTKGD